jgi:hypothetical protein
MSEPLAETMARREIEVDPAYSNTMRGDASERWREGIWGLLRQCDGFI